jgi:branched-chain amino acid transport system permease protein
LLGGGVAAVGTWFVAYRPLQHSERSSAILAAIGASICLQQLIARTAGAQSKAFSLEFWQGTLSIGGIQLGSVTVVSIASTALLLVLIHIFWKHSPVGLSARAVADDRDAAESVGIHTQGIVLVTFLFAGMAAGIAGIVLADSYSRVDPTMGFAPGLKAFVAALVAGLHDPRKAALGGFFLGALETAAVAIGLSAYRDAIVLGIMVAVMLVRARVLAQSMVVQAPLARTDT